MDLAGERAAGDLIRGLIRDGLVEAVHDCSDGGLYVAIAEMAIAGDCGADISTEGSDLPAHALLFGEDQGRYVVAVTPSAVDEVQARADEAGVSHRRTGRTGGTDLTVNGAEPISLENLKRVHEGWLPNYMDGAKTSV